MTHAEDLEKKPWCWQQQLPPSARSLAQ